MALRLVANLALCMLAVPGRLAPIGYSYGIPEDAVYDYVAVGTGNGDAPVAHRLAKAGHTVVMEMLALIEWNNATVHYASGKALEGVGEDIWARDGFPRSVQTTERATSKAAYRSPLIGRKPNLIMYQSTQAKQVIFTDKTTAISAGAFKTPQLLMTFGIGPAISLKRHNITVAAAELLGVGENLQDTTLAGPSYRINVITGSSNAVPSNLAQAQSQTNARPPRGLLTNPSVDILAQEKIPVPLCAKLSAEGQEGLSSFPADWSEV
ncbi:hypothetical protein BJX62DRAFT_234752 [Aspergillus germanicus]